MGLLQQRTAAREWYSSVAPFYEPVVAETFWPERLQRRLLAGLRLAPADRVLDLGCGTGLTARLAGDLADSVVGIDHSSQQLARTDPSQDGVRYLRGDAEHLPFPDDAFDAVVSVGAVIYFPDPVAALAEARRVTRPGGRILVAGFNRPKFPSWTPTENWATAVNETLFHTWDGADARREFSAAGWETIGSDVTGPAWHPRLARVVTATNTG